MIQVKCLLTNELFEFICFSNTLKGYFIFRTIPREDQFDIGNCSLYEPIGISWKRLYEKKS